MRLQCLLALLLMGNFVIHAADGGGGMGGDPHYSVLLPSGQLLCFSVQGETGFSFNLISNKLMHMNALFVQDAVRDEVTWIGELGIVVRNTPYKKFKHTKLRFVVEEKKIYIGEEVALQVQKIDKLTFSNGKLMINESSRTKGEKSPEVYVDLQDVGLSFKVRFTKSKHLDLSWERVAKQPADSHGMIGEGYLKLIMYFFFYSDSFTCWNINPVKVDNSY